MSFAPQLGRITALIPSINVVEYSVSFSLSRSIQTDILLYPYYQMVLECALNELVQQVRRE